MTRRSKQCNTTIIITTTIIGGSAITIITTGSGITTTTTIIITTTICPNCESGGAASETNPFAPALSQLLEYGGMFRRTLCW
jgi:hypothetical protein